MARPEIEHARHGEHLEHRAHLVDAEADPVQPVFVQRLLAVVRIEIGKRDEPDHFAGMHIDDQAGSGLGVEGRDRIGELFAENVLHAEVERNRDGLIPRQGFGVRHGKLGIVVDELLDTRKPLRVHIDQADHVARGRAHRIDAAIFVDEAEARQAKFVDFLLLLRRQFAFDAHKSAPGEDPLAKLSGVEVGEDARHLLDEFIHVDDLGGIGVEGGALDVGRQQPATPVKNIGAVNRRGDVAQAAGDQFFLGEAERDKPAANQHEGYGERKAGEAEAITAAREVGPLGARCGGI